MIKRVVVNRGWTVRKGNLRKVNAVRRYVKEEVDKGLYEQERTFPCVLVNDGTYKPNFENFSGYKTFVHFGDFELGCGKLLRDINVAYETWGTLNESKDNCILIGTGLSSNSHAKSHVDNPQRGWWEDFIGPGKAIDTEKYFVICTNVLGGCFGTTGPSSVNPVTGKRYGARFPAISVWDMVSVMFLLLDDLGIEKLYSYVGSSLGGMTSLAAAALFPDRVKKIISISGSAESLSYTIALRSMQRKIVMNDPFWNNGDYYDKIFPYQGMKLARQLGFITYRSGPEWEIKFGRNRTKNGLNSICGEFEIETYLDAKGEESAGIYDPNSFIWISKAMDTFTLADIGTGHTESEKLNNAMSLIKCPTLIMGVQTDILFPVSQQRKVAKILKGVGNPWVTYYEIDSIYGHDTFLLNLPEISAAIKGHLETDIPELRQKAKIPSMLG